MVLTLYCQVYNFLTARDAVEPSAILRMSHKFLKGARNRRTGRKALKMIIKRRIFDDASPRHGSVTTFEWLGLVRKFCMKLIRVHYVRPYFGRIRGSNTGCVHRLESSHFVIHDIEEIAFIRSSISRRTHGRGRRRIPARQRARVHILGHTRHRWHDTGRLLEW